MPKQILNIALLIVITTFIISCNDAPTEIQFDNARIELNGSMDGIKIGDDSLSVINKLGEPDYWGDINIDGYVMGFSNDKIGELEILFLKDSPVDSIYSVYNVIGRQTYSGKTIHGIGIGSTKDFVRNNLSAESENFAEGEFVDSYKKQNIAPGYLETHFNFYYDENNLVETIMMVYSK